MRLRLGVVRYVSVGVVALGPACGEAPVFLYPHIPLPGAFTTDSTVYIAKPVNAQQKGFTVIAQYHNSTSAPIHLDRCFPDSPHPIVGVQILVPRLASAGPLEAAYDPNYACVGNDMPIVVAAGAMRIDTLTFAGPTSIDAQTGASRGIFEGVFRLRYLASSCPVNGACVAASDSLVYSNDFTVTVSLFSAAAGSRSTAER